MANKIIVNDIHLSWASLFVEFLDVVPRRDVRLTDLNSESWSRSRCQRLAGSLLNRIEVTILPVWCGSVWPSLLCCSVHIRVPISVLSDQEWHIADRERGVTCYVKRLSREQVPIWGYITENTTPHLPRYYVSSQWTHVTIEWGCSSCLYPSQACVVRQKVADPGI